VNDNSLKIKKMASWTLAVFATIFAVVMAVLWTPLYTSGTPAFTAIGKALAEGWLMIVIALALSVGMYLGYSLYINRKK
jgi:cytochrome b subunit of formate dehydrogenase